MSETLAIASGKGGVGKTTISVNLALTQANSSNCLLLDADMGMAPSNCVHFGHFGTWAFRHFDICTFGHVWHADILTF